jgi:glyoxylase-like metal-dependent hydrolase (beta-lactamase superfamily II)
VDPGASWDEPLASLFEALDARLARGHALDSVLLTHHHYDHWGGLGAVLERYGPQQVHAHAVTIEAVGTVAGAQFCPMAQGDELRVAGVVLEAVFTPGHTLGHLAFLDRARGVLYGGDMVASEGTIMIDPGEGDMTQYLDSLAKLRELELQLLIPSHGAPIEAPHAVIDWYIQHRLHRESLVLEALTESFEGLDVVVLQAYSDVDPSLHWIASRSCLAHLQKLDLEGRAGREGERWRRVDGCGGGPLHPL